MALALLILTVIDAWLLHQTVETELLYEGLPAGQPGGDPGGSEGYQSFSVSPEVQFLEFPKQ